MRKRVLSLLLSVCMVLVLFPTVASANGNYTVEGRTATLTANDADSLQSALNDSGVDEVVIGAAISLPDGTNLDGKGKTVRVPSPYVNADGTKNGSASNFRVFNVAEGSTVSISNMTIMGGYVSSDGGGIASSGDITLENVTFTRSNRGLMEDKGKAVLKNCNFVMNIRDSAGAIWCGDGAKVVLDGCSFTNNHSSGTGGGGAIGVSGGLTNLFANNTVFANNATGEIGGAINLYGGNAYLINCTFTGNVTDCGTGCGGAIGNNGGNLYAANCIFVDNYASITDSLERSDVDNYNNSANSLLYNCLYGTTNVPSGTIITATDCKTDTGNETAFSYVNTGVTLRSGSTSVSFTHPDLASGTNAYAKYVPVNATGPAITGGIATYFDYSDLSAIKMGYGAPESITAFSGLTAPDSSKKVTTYFEGGTRSDGVIGASAPKAEYTVTNGTPESDKATNHGYIAIDKTSAAEDETVTVTVAPSAGYQLKAGSLKVNDGAVTITCKGIGKYEFTMPKAAVAVTAKFEIVLPYFFDFESDFIAAGWTNIDADGDGQDWITATNIYGAEGWGVEGSRCAISQSYDNNLGAFNADNWLFSPAITIPEGGATVSWYEQSQDVSYPDFYEVYVSETNTSTDTSKMTKIFSGTAANPWNQRSVELEAAEYAGKTVYIAFRHLCYDYYMLEIDNFAVGAEAPAHTHTVTFDANGGSVTPTSAETGTDGKLATLPTPTRSGSYSFDGWYTMKEGGTKVDTNTVFTAAATIYAHWSRSFSFAHLPKTGVATITVPEGDYYTGVAAKDAFILYWDENIKTNGDFILIDYVDTDINGYHSWTITIENGVPVATDGGFMEYYTTLDLINNEPFYASYDKWVNGTYTAIHTHAFTYTANNGKVTATCVDGCDDGYDTNPLTLTLTAPASLVYNRNAKAFTFADGEAAAWTGAGLELPIITYAAKSGSSLTSDKAVDAGSYTASVTVDTDKTASLDFEITKATPYIKTNPEPTEIELGKKLADSTIVDGYVHISSTDSTEVAGLFAWTQPDTMPAIADSNVTLYDLIFTPVDEKNYNTVTCQVTITVNHTHNPKLVNGQAPQKGIAGWKDYFECICGERYEDASGSILIPDLAVWKAEGGNGYLAPLTPAKYTVTFNMGNHGTQIDPQTVEEGNMATKPSDPTAEGWTFDGWYADATFSVAFDFNTAITANTTVYAKWTENPGPQPVVYTIIVGAGSEWTKGETEGLLITSDAPFAKFSSVKVDESTIAATNYAAEEGSTKITLAPAYLETLSVGTHSIEIVSNDGSASTNFTIKATVPPVPTSYTVTFNMNGHGTQITAQTVESGFKATKPADPKASGYIFGGWYADATFSTKFDFNTAITANTTVYAKWTKNSAAPADPTSPQTGDTSNMFLWVALLLVSGGALVGTTVYGKKRKRAE